MPTFEVEFTKEYFFVCEELIEAENEQQAREIVETRASDFEDGVLEESAVEVTKVTVTVPSQWLWLVTVRDGYLIGFPPELHTEEDEALLAARRIASGLGVHRGPIDASDPKHITTLDWVVDVTPVEVPIDANEVWIGNHVGESGLAFSGIVVRTSREDAEAWVREVPPSASLESVECAPDRIIASFYGADCDEFSVIHRSRRILSASRGLRGGAPLDMAWH